MNRRQVIGWLGTAFAAWPGMARAQEAAPVIGFMSSRSPGDSAHLVDAFRQGLREAGFVEGQNITIEFRWADGRYDRLPSLAAELVQRRVVVLVGVGGVVSAVAAKGATSTIPIVFGIGLDPVETGLVESIGRPGGNATGYTLWTNQMESKRVGLLGELMPGAELVGVLVNPKFPPAARQLAEIQDAARAIGQKLLITNASNDEELATALGSLLQQRVNAVLIGADPYFDTQRDRVIAFAAENRLPAMYQFREFAVAGGLMSYGPNLTDGYRQGGEYTGRILKGAKPAELPVLQPTKYELVINLKTAKALGLTIPPALLARADEVIE